MSDDRKVIEERAEWAAKVARNLDIGGWADSATVARGMIIAELMRQDAMVKT